MAKYNHAFGVSFNDNDGGVGFFATSNTFSDVARYRKIFGVWRSRWIFLKRFWLALRSAERSIEILRMEDTKPPVWVFKPEIPE